MNTKSIVVLVLITLILTGCQEPTVSPTPISTAEPTNVENVEPITIPENIQTPEGKEAFAIFLVADPR